MTAIKRGTRAITLKDVPEDVFEILITEQTRFKLDRGAGQFGLDQVIYRHIRALSKLVAMPRRQFDQEDMCNFARFVSAVAGSSTHAPQVTLLLQLEEWKKNSGEYKEDRQTVTPIGKTVGDVLGLKGPKSEPP